MSSPMKGKKLNISPEERKRRSDQAKELARQGKIGGDRRSEGAGQRKLKLAAEKFSEEADKNATAMIRELKKIITSPDKNTKPNDKVAAIRLWMDLANKENEKQMNLEQNELENASREDMLKILEEKLGQALEAGMKVPNFDNKETEAITVESEEVEIG